MVSDCPGLVPRFWTDLPSRQPSRNEDCATRSRCAAWNRLHELPKFKRQGFCQIVGGPVFNVDWEPGVGRSSSPKY